MKTTNIIKTGDLVKVTGSEFDPMAMSYVGQFGQVAVIEYDHQRHSNLREVMFDNGLSFDFWVDDLSHPDHDDILLVYNRLSSDQKRAFTKNEIERKRKQFRGEEPRNGLSAELTKAFSALACQLSPENLYQDGEITERQAVSKKQKIMQEWRKLERKANRTVGLNEFPY